MNLGTFCPLEKNWHILTPLAATKKSSETCIKQKMLIIQPLLAFINGVLLANRVKYFLLSYSQYITVVSAVLRKSHSALYVAEKAQTPKVSVNYPRELLCMQNWSSSVINSTLYASRYS
jgi:hypothetical protein